MIVSWLYASIFQILVPPAIIWSRMSSTVTDTAHISGLSCLYVLFPLLLIEIPSLTGPFLSYQFLINSHLRNAKNTALYFSLFHFHECMTSFFQFPFPHPLFLLLLLPLVCHPPLSLNVLILPLMPHSLPSRLSDCANHFLSLSLPPHSPTIHHIACPFIPSFPYSPVCLCICDA